MNPLGSCIIYFLEELLPVRSRLHASEVVSSATVDEPGCDTRLTPPRTTWFGLGGAGGEGTGEHRESPARIPAPTIRRPSGFSPPRLPQCSSARFTARVLTRVPDQTNTFSLRGAERHRRIGFQPRSRTENQWCRLKPRLGSRSSSLDQSVSSYTRLDRFCQGRLAT